MKPEIVTNLYRKHGTLVKYIKKLLSILEPNHSQNQSIKFPWICNREISILNIFVLDLHLFLGLFESIHSLVSQKY